MANHAMWVGTVAVMILTVDVAKADGRSDFFTEYAPYHEKATAHFFRNVAITGTKKQYDTYDLGRYQVTYSFNAVCGVDTLLYRNVVKNNQSGKPLFPESGGAVTPDAGYEVVREDGSNEFTLSAHAYPWSKGTYFDLYSESGAGLAWPVYAIYIERGSNRYRAFPLAAGTTFTRSKQTFRGTDCVAATVTTDRGSFRKVYLRMPDYLVVGIETVVQDRKPYHKMVEVHYGPPQADTGLPFPTSVKGWFVTADGSKPTAEDVEFTEYRRYTPTAGEVDVATVFGVAVLPVPARPPLPPVGHFMEPIALAQPVTTSAHPGRASRYWYAAASALALAAGGLAYVVRRRVRANAQ